MCPRCEQSPHAMSSFVLFHVQVWDYMPQTLQTEEVSKSSYALLGASGVLSLGLAMV